LAHAGFILYQTSFLASLAQGLAASGQRVGAVAAVNQAIAQCDRTGESWLLAELYRIRGDIRLREGEADLLQALEIARGQGALAWELRTATSLARHWQAMHRSTDARTLISAALAKFTEGFATPDHRAASALLSDLG